MRQPSNRAAWASNDDYTAFSLAVILIGLAFGAWMLCFWCGQMVQMLSSDVLTYWRVLPLYFWVLALAVRA